MYMPPMIRQRRNHHHLDNMTWTDEYLFFHGVRVCIPVSVVILLVYALLIVEKLY